MKTTPLKKLLHQIQACHICEDHLPFAPNPILQVNKNAKILVIGQAPGLKAHQSKIPWNDASGDRLREWTQLSADLFYDEQLTALVPMGFCYPGKSESGDRPPRKECFLQWHQQMMSALPNIKLTLLVGNYAQDMYLKSSKKKSLTETVRHYDDYLPKFFPLPHPSPLNNIWLSKNPWFQKEVLPVLQKTILGILDK